MKRILLIMGMLLMGIPTLRAQSEAPATETPTRKVAILEVVDRDGVLNYGVKLLLRSTLAKAITQTPGYEGYDRVDMGAIQGEQDFQRTGMVSDDQIKRLGEMTGAAYVLVAEAAKIDESTMIVTAKIINVETAKLERTDYEQMGFESKVMGAACQRMANRLLRVSSSTVGVNVPSENGENKVGNESIFQKIKSVFQKEKQPTQTSFQKETPTSYIPSGKIVFKGGCLQEEAANYGFYKKIGRTNTALYLGDLYREYKKAIAIRGGGIFCMSAGGGFVAGGGLLILTSYGWDGDLFIGGVAMAVTGVGLLVAGAPMYAIANKKIKKMLQIAEEQHLTTPYKTACTFDFNTRHGVGFNLSF